jgi:hypothetical protein
MFSKGINQSSMSIGSRGSGSKTSRTSKKTKATEDGSSSDEQTYLDKIQVMNTGIQQVEDDSSAVSEATPPKKKKWGLTRSSTNRVPKTIKADDDSCSTVSVLEEPAKPATKSFDDVLDDFLVDSGIADLMNIFSPPKKEGEEDAYDEEFIICQDIGCQGKRGTRDALNFEDEDGSCDDELDDEEDPGRPFDEPWTTVSPLSTNIVLLHPVFCSYLTSIHSICSLIYVFSLPKMLLLICSTHEPKS